MSAYADGRGSDFFEKLSQIGARIGGRLRLGMVSRSTHIGLRRDIQVPFKNPDAKISISVRPLIQEDIATVLPMDGADQHERMEIAARRAFASRRLAGGYVAVDDRNGTPCYVQWLLGAADNDLVATLGGFPKLARDEALLENAYTPPAYRGMGIMPAAMARIAERAVDLGARYVLTFVHDDNIASLKGCVRSGFAPYLLHPQSRYAFGTFRRGSFVTLAPDDPLRSKTF